MLCPYFQCRAQFWSPQLQKDNNRNGKCSEGTTRPQRQASLQQTALQHWKAATEGEYGQYGQGSTSHYLFQHRS